MSLPSAADQTFTNKTLTISKQRFFPFSWTGEEENSMNTGPGFLTMRQSQIAQAMRAAVNEIEADIATAASAGASRAYGATAGTAPVLADWSAAKKILDDNGAPMSDRTTVINTTAGAALRNTSALYQVNTSGESGLLRNGTLGNLYGFDIRESAQVKLHTPGTAANYLINNGAGEAVGETTIALDTGPGTHVAGDVVTVAGDANKYVVDTGAAGSGAKNIVLADPGLRILAADNAAVTTGAAYRANMGFHRSAMVFVTRAPALPEEGDMAADRMVITDPRTGLSFEVAMYLQYRRVRYEVSAAWGGANIKPRHTAILLG
jgi:hypothetical protein